jgi:hypothetical protein
MRRVMANLAKPKQVVCRIVTALTSELDVVGVLPAPALTSHARLPGHL